MLKYCLDHIDTVLLGLAGDRQHAGIGSEIRIVFERNDRIFDRIFSLSLSTNGTRKLSRVMTFETSFGAQYM